MTIITYSQQIDWVRNDCLEIGYVQWYEDKLPLQKMNFEDFRLRS